VHRFQPLNRHFVAIASADLSQSAEDSLSLMDTQRALLRWAMVSPGKIGR